MKKILCATALLSATLGATSAQADDTKYFDGAYVGAEGGYIDAGDGANGVAYGGFAGFRTQTNSGLVFGVEGSFGSADIDYLDHIWTATGTIGFTVGAEKRGLLFIGGGYASAKASAFGYSATGDDFTIVGGYEHALSDTWSVRAKASYLNEDAVSGTIGVLARF